MRRPRGVYKGRKAPKRKGPPERPMVRKVSKAFAVPCQLTARRLAPLAGLMLALHWPSDPDLWTLAFGHWSRRTLVAIGAGRFGARHFRLGMVRETGSINRRQFNSRSDEWSRRLSSVRP